MVTVRVPAYVFEHDKHQRFIVGAYSQTLANRFSRKTKNLCLERGVPISKERRAVDEWETIPDPHHEAGAYRAAGILGGVTGMGSHGLLLDDPVKNRKEANSPVYRESIYEAYTDDFLTRLEPEGWIILIMTRWHQGDLAGRLIKEQGTRDEGGEWEVINLPALAESTDILGRDPGEALCPERYDEKALNRIKNSLGESFYALFQGRPTAEDGAIIKRTWFLYFRHDPAPNITLEIVQSWDTSSGKNELAAYSVCTTWAITRLGYYLIDVYRERLDYPNLKRAAISKAEQYRPNAVLIEDKSSGQALIQDLRSSSMVPVVAIEPEGDKVTRLAIEAVAYESGKVYHKEGAPWLADLEAELVSFPHTDDLDQGDSVSQFLTWARKRSFVFDWDSSGRAAAFDDFEQDAPKINQSKGWGTIQGGNDFGDY
jgi:predicted phage terminase large subunit-like protein